MLLHMYVLCAVLPLELALAGRLVATSPEGTVQAGVACLKTQERDRETRRDRLSQDEPGWVQRTRYLVGLRLLCLWSEAEGTSETQL